MADPYQDHPDVSPGVDSIWSSVGGATMWVPGSANGGSITAVYNVVGQYGADNTGVVDATTAIQNALDAANTAGGGVVYVPRGSYLFTQLKMYSNVCLWLDGTLTQKAGTNTATIVNAAYVAGTGRDSNISIIGRGKIDRGANAGTGLNRNIVMFQRVDGVVIKGLGGLLNFASTGGKFAVNLYACTNFEVGGLQLSVAADGVHITHPRSRPASASPRPSCRRSGTASSRPSRPRPP